MLCSQKYYTFEILAKCNVMNVQGVLCKHTTVEPLAISMLGTPIISNRDPISKLLINKAHLREIHASVRPIHSTASTTLARLMTGHFVVLLINGEEMVEQFMSSCVTCRKNRMLHYIAPVGMSDTRMLPTVHPFAMISIDPITSWPIILPDNSIKKLPILIVLCRQTGFVWHKILFNWTTKSFTLAIMILQYRYGKVQSIVSDQGSNMNPLNLKSRNLS